MPTAQPTDPKARTSASTAAPPLSPEARVRGRRIAISSHPAGMTFWMAFTQNLPTLFLVSLGASETQVGLQQSFLPGLQVLQLPTLRSIAWLSKRSILLCGQLFALTFALPVLFAGQLARYWSDLTLPMVLLSFALVAIGLNVGNTVWFPLLRSYVETARIGHFFGMLRSGWHLALILYYLGAQLWLARHPDDFAPLFAAAWLAGLLRIALIARLPERSERSEARIRIREAFALVRELPDLRRYLMGVAGNGAIRTAVLTFAIVLLRREVGFSAGQVVATAISSYAGGFASLYLWGRAVDRFGPAPIFRVTSLGLAGLLLLLPAIDSPGTAQLAIAVLFFFCHAVLTAGFGVADTQVLFSLAPPEAPARTLVIAGVLTSSIVALAPILAGGLLEVWLRQSGDPLMVYRTFFLSCALLQTLVLLPLRKFRLPAAVL